MRTKFSNAFIALPGLAFALCGRIAASQSNQAQSQPQAQPLETAQRATQRPQQSSPGGDVGRGAGNIGKVFPHRHEAEPAPTPAGPQK
jgi:hypothetical protein